MADKSKTQQSESQCVKRRAPQPALHVSRDLTPQAQLAAALQRVLSAPRSRMRPADILALQRAVGNRTIQQLMTGLVQGQTQQEEEGDTSAAQIAPFVSAALGA